MGQPRSLGVVLNRVGNRGRQRPHCNRTGQEKETFMHHNSQAKAQAQNQRDPCGIDHLVKPIGLFHNSSREVITIAATRALFINCVSLFKSC